MIKGFIADDEIFIIKGLLKKIKWDDFYIQIVGTATDGIEAYNMIIELKPEIIITDIRMPGINGLELIEKVRNNLPQSLFIIISGYDDFEYLQKALRIGVFDYILKPIDSADLEKILIRAIKRIKENSSDDCKVNEIKQSIKGRIHNNTVNNIVEYIENNYCCDFLTLNFVADKFDINPSYLSTIFKKVTGYNFYDYVNRTKVKKAKQLLAYTNYKVTDICRKSGFSDYRQFIRIFKKLEKRTPSQYRIEEGMEKIWEGY